MAKLVRYQGGAVEAPTIRRTQQAAISEEARGFQQIASSLDRMSNFLYARGMDQKAKREKQQIEQLQENTRYQVSELIKERGFREVLEMKGEGPPENLVEKYQQAIGGNLLIIDAKANTTKNAKFLYQEAVANNLSQQEFNNSIDSLSAAYLSEYGKYIDPELYLQARTEIAASLSQYKTDFSKHTQNKIFEQKKVETLEYVSGLYAEVRNIANDPFTYDQQLIDLKVKDITDAYAAMNYSAEDIESAKIKIYEEALIGRINAQYKGINSYSGKVKFVENLDKDPTVLEAFTSNQIDDLKATLLKKNEHQVKVINSKITDVKKTLKDSLEILNSDGSFSESGIQALASQVNMLIENADGLPIDLTEVVDMYDDVVLFNSITNETKGASTDEINNKLLVISQQGLPGRGDDGRLDTDIEVKVVNFLEKRRNAVDTKLQKNPLDYALASGFSLTPLNFDDPVNFIPKERLDEISYLKNEYFGYKPKVFTIAEQRAISEAYSRNNVQDKITLVTAIVKNSGEYADVAIEQIAEDNPELASIAAMALTIGDGTSKDLLRDAFLGMESAEKDPEFGKKAWSSDNANAIFDQNFVAAFPGQNPAQINQYRKISKFIYKQRYVSDEEFDDEKYKDILQQITGNRIGEVRGVVTYSGEYSENKLASMLDILTTKNLEDMGNSNVDKNCAKRMRASDNIKIESADEGNTYYIYELVDGQKHFYSDRNGNFIKFRPDDFEEFTIQFDKTIERTLPEKLPPNVPPSMM